MTEDTSVSNHENETADNSSWNPDMSGSDKIAANIAKGNLGEASTDKSGLNELTANLTNQGVVDPTPKVTPPVEEKLALDLDEQDLAAIDELNPPLADSYEFPKEFLKEDGTVDEQAFLKDYYNKNKLIGKKGLIPPKSVDEYSLEESEVFQGAEFDDEGLKRTKAWALEQGLSNKQYQAAMEYWYKSQADAEALASQQPGICTKKLREVWGDEKYDDNIALAGVALREFGQGVPRDGIQHNPSVIQLLANIGRELQEDSAPSRTKTDGLLTEEEVDKIMSADDYWENPEKRKMVMDHLTYMDKKGKLNRPAPGSF